ncbi:MAG: hypothetical protein K9M98_10010 [Cephaloticoccus sp.]|nr:hypothetical protein [Cephaloticoccus sp.]MCF7760827.1 hypothetical protein [Cephaloticoccus sp.]
MTPAPTDSVQLINTLRQQLILAQVRIMELEDERDQLTPRLDEIESLLAEAQKLVDLKLDETAHLQQVVADSQAQATTLQSQLTQSASELSTISNQLGQSEREARDMKEQFTESVNNLTSRLNKLQGEIERCHSSRSWRWTAWLRCLAGFFNSKGA